MTQEQLDAWRLYITGQQPAGSDEAETEIEIEPAGDDDLTIVEE